MFSKVPSLPPISLRGFLFRFSPLSAYTKNDRIVLHLNQPINHTILLNGLHQSSPNNWRRRWGRFPQNFSFPPSLFSNSLSLSKTLLSLFQEFDWEAAVHEIDVACENTNKSSASSLPIDHSHKKLGTSRQSTLDKFMGTTSVRTENQSGRDRNSYKEGGDEGASCVKIDPEAAKTWIYPGFICYTTSILLCWKGDFVGFQTSVICWTLGVAIL